MLNMFKNKEEELDTISVSPVNKKAIEDAIKIVNVAHETGAYFDLKFDLSVGEFSVDESEYTAIKLLPKNKKEPDRVAISYSNDLLSHDTVIHLENIINITLKLKYYGKGDISAKTE